MVIQDTSFIEQRFGVLSATQRIDYFWSLPGKNLCFIVVVLYFRKLIVILSLNVCPCGATIGSLVESSLQLNRRKGKETGRFNCN